MSPPVFRVFFAHPKDFNEAPAWAAEITARLAQQGVVARVTTGTDFFNEAFARCGGWDGWCQEVAQGTTFELDVAGQRVLAPLFHAVVVGPNVAIGRATAAIVNRARELNKPVVFFDPGRGFIGVIGAMRVEESWQDGYRINLVSQQNG